MQRKLFILLMLMLVVVVHQAAARLPQADSVGDERCFVATGNVGAVSCGHPLAAAAALQILHEGGNAVDAAIAAGFMLGVVDFSNSGIGGDGFALIYRPDGLVEAWDASVKRPRLNGNRTIVNHIGLPTVPELLLRLRRQYGSRTLATLMQPAVSAAANGFKISAYLEKTIEKTLPNIDDPAAISFLAPHGYPLRAGQILKQPFLARTLAEMARDEGRSFYRGSTAIALIADMQKHGSQYRISDLALFKTRQVKPVRRDWQNYSLFGNPPPACSIASIKLAEDLLNSRIDLHEQRPEDILATARAGRRILQARYENIAECLDDPYRFIEFADKVAVNSSGDVVEAGNTTHLCVADKNGMLVSMTLTLGSHFGTGEFSPGGFFYNNGLRNFTDAVAGYPDNYPTDAGPISTKSPIIVTRNGEPVLTIGGAGSERIVFNVGLALARYLHRPQQTDHLISSPRYFLDHRQKLIVEWQPDTSLVKTLEQWFPETTIKPGCDDYFGLLSAIIVEGSQFKALADPRRDGSCAACDLISP
ncbi:MAG: Gamma-glutamyltranspeptidase [Candidatus Rifleibacterium amylolyticum]|nr:MAG: Gamma-glutamyltranspeptidase [Candidatus Rifleibacterium amylolyticum]